MKRLLSLLILFSIAPFTKSQITSEYYLPKTVTYNQNIPTPKQFFSHGIGEWHLSHDKLYSYMLELAKISGRAIWEEYAKSYENRSLGHLIISSPENIKNIEMLRQEHVRLCDPTRSQESDLSKMPVFVKLGYGIHGNESSAQNAAALVAYYLIAGEGGEIENILSNMVIMIDPALNPDGMQRHSSWVNAARSLNNNSDPASWEFSEPWPGGRTNHYWFDLNRDYIMLQHPESKGRVAAYHKWKPNIITDHHEMGPDETFFFQPGVQSRNNPLTPEENYELTAEIGKYHEKYLDSIGSLYFTEDSFDDYYVGKGSSYPDIHGSVGILFEQAGVKGHLKETPGGLLSFPFAIRNHFTVSLSTIEAGLKLKDRLLESQRNFYKTTLSRSEKYPVRAFVFSEPSDNSRLSEFINILLRHQIRVYKTSRDIEKNGMLYESGNSYLVPLNQPEFLFIRSLFEPVVNFTDSAFYDISTWCLPMSFNINCSTVTASKELDGLTGSEVTAPPFQEGKLFAEEKPYAYLFEWSDYYSPKALYLLQNKGLITRVSTEGFIYNDGILNKTFSAGTIVVPATGQPVSGPDLQDLMENTAKECSIKIFGVTTGLTKKGIDLGSNRIIVLDKPSVAMIIGEGINSSVAGEIWHLLDSRFSIPVTMIRASQFGTINLDRYNVLIINGSPEISQAGLEKIKNWNQSGKVIIGVESGNKWLNKNKFAEIEFIPEASPKRINGIYGNKTGDNQVHQIPGSIFRTELDLTHPLCFGFTRDQLPVFKSTVTIAKKEANAYNNPIRYTDDPLLSGFCSKENLERIKGSAFASVHGNRIISIYDDPNFRAIWYGTNKVFLNALFFGQILR
jgi:hypothetical protein